MAVILVVEDDRDTRQALGIDGVEAARRLRAEWAAADVPIVALTGDTSPDTLRRVERAGFAAFLRKPADLDRLETVLRPLLGGVPSS